jgi:hypothetical protein
MSAKKYGGNAWKDVTFSLGITLDERVLPTELPMHLGKSDSLDKRIAAILQTEPRELYYLDGKQLIGIPFPLEFDGESMNWVELEIEGTSSGYYDVGNFSDPSEDCYPPESDDERIITSVNVVFFDESHQILGQMEIVDEGKLHEFQEAFDETIYETDLPEGYDDPPEPDYPDEY